MATWHDRLQHAIEARGLDWIDLFSYLNKKTSITKQSVYAWKPNAEKRSTMMNADNAVLVCEWLKISPLWLFFGEENSGLEEDLAASTLVEAIKKLPADKRATAEQLIYGLVALDDAQHAAAFMQQQQKAI